MAKQTKNLPIDERWHDKTPLGNMAKNHSYVDGEYLESEYSHQEFPKMKYHPDFVAEKKDGVEYSYTQVAQQVNSREDEEELGEDWKDSPGELGIITAPDAAFQNKKRKEAASRSWREAAMPDKQVIGEEHLEFLKAAGAPVKNMADVYTLLAQMTKQQCDAFMAEVKAAQEADGESDEVPATPQKRNKKEKALVTA